MRKLILILSALGLSARAQASPGPHVDEQAVFGGGYFGDRFEVSSPLFKPYYILEASAHGFRYPSAFSGTAVEYSAALRRELYHVSIAGRLGTRPPGAEGESYHLAAGEGIMTFYGLALGPEHPDLSGQVWESSGPAPAPKSLDRTWVTRLRGRFTTTNHHFANPPGFVLIQNSIQFDVTETWRERSTLTLHAGAHVYNEPVTKATPTVYLDNINYPGNVMALRGWPNNSMGLRLSEKIGRSWEAQAAFTRLNLLGNQVDFLYGLNLVWRPNANWRLRAGYNLQRLRAVQTQQTCSLGVGYFW